MYVINWNFFPSTEQIIKVWQRNVNVKRLQNYKNYHSYIHLFTLCYRSHGITVFLINKSETVHAS